MNKNKNALHNQKHLTLSDRTYMEQELLQKSSFTSIASNLKKDSTTIAKEIKRYSRDVPVKGNRSCIKCKNYEDCDLLSRESSCSRYDKKYCPFYCRKCYRYYPPSECLYYIPFKCDKIKKPPYVCNYCSDQKDCPLTKKIYDAAYAQKQYEKTFVK
ncbi:MAG: helix-turn-helix domain-containing protein [Lachnospiraceae bacterium]|nr:helix-turn-helix domain-containing protein [Lachnospiraceae bacterium]